MKRTLFVMFMLVLSIAFVPSVFAGKTVCDSGCDLTSTTFGGGDYKPSAKVTVDVTATDGLAYCATSEHSGAATNQTAGRQFGTTSISPQIQFAPSETTGKPKACTNQTTMADPSTGSWQ